MATRLFETLAATSLLRAKLKFPLPLAVPLPTCVPVQLFKNTFTVTFAPAVPVTVGLRLLPGDVGVVDVNDGAVSGAAVVKLQLVSLSAFPASS